MRSHLGISTGLAPRGTPYRAPLQRSALEPPTYGPLGNRPIGLAPIPPIQAFPHASGLGSAKGLVLPLGAPPRPCTLGRLSAPPSPHGRRSYGHSRGRTRPRRALWVWDPIGSRGGPPPDQSHHATPPKNGPLSPIVLCHTRHSQTHYLARHRQNPTRYPPDPTHHRRRPCARQLEFTRRPPGPDGPGGLLHHHTPACLS